MSEHKISTLLTENLAVTVHFDYQPKEPETLTYPGTPAVVEMNSVCIGSHDIMQVLSESVLGDLADRCMESMDSDED